MTYKNIYSERSAKYKKHLFDNGLCTWCAKPFNGKRKLCPSCQKKNGNIIKQKRKNRLKNGLCYCCDNLREPGSNCCCYKHWMQKTCINRTGNVRNWEYIAELFEKQGRICPYTGINLVLGQNAQLDHKIPLIRGGTNEPENLEWIDSEINRMKGKRTKNEFISICIKISKLSTESLGSIPRSPRL